MEALRGAGVEFTLLTATLPDLVSNSLAFDLAKISLVPSSPKAGSDSWRAIDFIKTINALKSGYSAFSAKCAVAFFFHFIMMACEQRTSISFMKSTVLISL